MTPKNSNNQKVNSRSSHLKPKRQLEKVICPSSEYIQARLNFLKDVFSVEVSMLVA
jgi:hypothetical protein